MKSKEVREDQTRNNCSDGGPAEVIIIAGGFKPLGTQRQLDICDGRQLSWLQRLACLILSKPRNPGMTKGWDIKVGGKYTVELVVEALRTSERIGPTGRIILVADLDPGITFSGVNVVVPPGSTIGESLRNGRRELINYDRRTLVMCADLPFLTGSSIDRFIEKCEVWQDAQLCIGYVPRELSELEYPENAHTWARFWNGKTHEYYCSGGLAIIDPIEIDDIAMSMDQFHGSRKSVLALAWKIGLIDLIYYVFGYYTIANLQIKLCEIFKLSCVGICADDLIEASWSFNIDDMKTLEYAEKYYQYHQNAARRRQQHNYN